MKILIEFALKRRLGNPVALLLLVFTFCLSGAILFSDLWISLIAYDWIHPIPIHGELEIQQFLNELVEPQYIWVESKDDAKIHIDIQHEKYNVTVDASLGVHHVYQMENWIQQFHSYIEIAKQPMDFQEEVLSIFYPEVSVMYEPRVKENHSGFILITSIYFMMLSFSSAMANEIVMEKTSNMLEMILTSVSFKVHYYAKMVIGWLSVFTQTTIYGAVILFWTVIRQLYDQGAGLFQMLYQIRWIDTLHPTLLSWISAQQLNSKWFAGLGVGLLFLFLGILVVQIVMVMISIRIEHMEEAASVQGPFYLVLLLIYYASIFLNTPTMMNEGIGYAFSFIPVFSMLFMPMRFLFYSASWTEVLLSLSLSIGAWFLLAQWGENHYKNHLIRGSKKAKM